MKVVALTAFAVFCVSPAMGEDAATNKKNREYLNGFLTKVMEALPAKCPNIKIKTEGAAVVKKAFADSNSPTKTHDFYSGVLEAARMLSVLSASDCASDDIIALTTVNPEVFELASGEPETLSTKQAVQAFAPGDYRPVDPKDLQLGPRKFIGKPIELRNMQCFYADINEYRCWARGAGMTVFATTIIDYPAKDKFDDFCGRQKNADTAACRKTLHIVPEEWSQDQPSAFGKRTLITVKELRFVGK